MNHRIAEFTRICCTMGVGNCQLWFWVDSCPHAVKRCERKTKAQLTTGEGADAYGLYSANSRSRRLAIRSA